MSATAAPVPQLEIWPTPAENLANAMRELKDAGWWIIGLEGEAKQELTDLKFSGKTVLVLGAEGKGVRPSVAEACEARARIPIAPEIESLNVSVAAAITLYEAQRNR